MNISDEKKYFEYFLETKYVESFKYSEKGEHFSDLKGKARVLPQVLIFSQRPLNIANKSNNTNISSIFITAKYEAL